MRRISSLFFIILVTYQALGQNVPLGSWRSHFSYQSARLIANSENKIFCAAENGFFSLDVQTNKINTFNKTNGLSDVGATALAYDFSTSTLIIGYASGLVDLVTTEGIETLTDINRTNLIGNKTIQSIIVQNGIAFLGTSFGVILVDLTDQEITETFGSIGPTGNRVTAYEMEIWNDRLYVTTDIGIQSGSLSDNLLDFNNWTHYPNPANDVFYHFAVYNDSIYSIMNLQDLSVLVDDKWEKLTQSPNKPISKILSAEDGLYLLSPSEVFRYDQVAFESDLVIPSGSAVDFSFNGNGLWIADEEVGLLNPQLNAITPNGTLSDEISKIKYSGGQVFSFYAPNPLSYFGQTTHNQYSTFNGNSWETIEVEDFYNISDVASYNGSYYFGSIGYGIYHEGELLDESNLLHTSKQGYGPLITALDAGPQLYIASFNSTFPLYSLNSEGEVSAVNESILGTDRLDALDITSQGTLWLSNNLSEGGGIVAFDPIDETSRAISTFDNLPSNNINDLVINLDDEVWIATGSGPSYYSNGNFAFENIDMSSPIYEGFNLFDDETITAVETDGGNRVWMSTNDGVWVFDNAITRQIYHFNTSNSPLPSNNIKQFAYHEQTGEMFILTNKGLVSYRSNSSLPSNNHSNAKIFPNPVHPGYDGLVGISGIVQSARVKVTDINGKLIRELEVNGGTASWDLLDYNSNRVQSGVYIVLSSNEAGDETFIGKLAVIN